MKSHLLWIGICYGDFYQPTIRSTVSICSWFQRGFRCSSLFRHDPLSARRKWKFITAFSDVMGLVNHIPPIKLKQFQKKVITRKNPRNTLSTGLLQLQTPRKKYPRETLQLQPKKQISTKKHVILITLTWQVGIFSASPFQGLAGKHRWGVLSLGPWLVGFGWRLQLW